MTTQTPTVDFNAFSLRQTADSPFTHFGGTNAELLALVMGNIGNATEDEKRPGVLTVPVQGQFFCPTIALKEGATLVSAFAPRANALEGEEANIHTYVDGGEKYEVGEANVIIYSQDALLKRDADGNLTEGTDATTEADFEIVTILAQAPGETMDPLTMARNFLDKTGGTKAEYTAEEFAQAIWFWSQHAKPYVPPRS
jgi:hypothetical protein